MWLRCFVCLVFVVAWTLALLTPQPVTVGKAVLPAEVLFPAAKVLHVTAYAIMAILMGWLRLPVRSRVLLVVFLSSHALGTEFFQQFVPSRHGCWLDVGFDHLGIVLGMTSSRGWWFPRMNICKMAGRTPGPVTP